MRLKTLIASVTCALSCAMPARADEGLWTFDNFPSAKVEQAYGVKIDKAWLDHLQAATVRLTTGCSGSVVSKAGLVLTNHHCVVECVQALSSAASDHMKNGFLTASRAEERKCPGMQAEILVSVTDITSSVNAATAGKTGGDFVAARDATAARAEDAVCGGDPRYRCQMVSLYRGGAYQIYKHRRYADVRLAFAPEFSTAFFGGDPDNFNFPRFNLDMAFVRLYEDGIAVVSPNHLAWKPRAPRPGEPVFVAGSPGTTERLMTVAQLETQRDLAIPLAQLQRSELRGRLIAFSHQDAEARRLVTDPLFGTENAFKVNRGRQAILNSRAFLDSKRADEAALRAKVAADPALAAQVGDPWREIEVAQAAYAQHHVRLRQLETYAGSNSDLFNYARILVRAAQERARPSAERLPEYSDAKLALLEKEVLDPRPVEPRLEAIYLEFWLSKTREYLTADDPATRLLLGSESPEDLAAKLATTSILGDAAARKALWDGGLDAIAASGDPMIHMAWRIDPAARAVRRAWESEVTGPVAAASERIALARFAAYGQAVYPDATSSLRLSYGTVAGWTYQGVTVPPTTTIAGLYNRATGAEPYALPTRWAAAKARLDQKAVLNFVTTNDIIGGNSGSPVVSATGELLGAAFDGNIHSLGGVYGYDGAVNRTVVVSTVAATEALRKVYGRADLVKELTGR
jgi:hypothetical protein